MKKLFILILLCFVLIGSASAETKISVKRNVSDTATITSFALNSTTSVELSDGTIDVEVNWIISNGSMFDVWIKFEAAATDNDKEGIVLMSGTNIALVFGRGFYTGPISAIAQTDNPTIYITRY